MSTRHDSTTARARVRAEARRRREAGSVHVALPVASRREADWGGAGHHYRDVLVDVIDGRVRAWDRVAGHYSSVHDLTPEQVAEARRRAGAEEVARG